MVTAVSRGELVFRKRRRWAVECLALEGTLTLLLVMAVAVIVGSGPVDYRTYGWLAAGTVCSGAVLLVPVFLLRFTLGPRVSVVFSPDGINTGGLAATRIPWSQVVSVGIVWRLADRQVQLTVRDGSVVRLFAPRGSAWLPDAAFRHQTAELRLRATRYNAGIEHDGRERRWPAAAGALLVLAVLTAAAGRAGDRGVIWPTTPTATHVTTACQALQDAGVDRFWPADTRTLDRDENDHLDLGDYSFCWWVNHPGDTREAPYIRLSADVESHRAFAMASPIAMAADRYHADRAGQISPVPVHGLSDDAFISSSADQVLVTARRANVTVSINVNFKPGRQQQAEMAARALTAAILTGIHLGDATKRR